MKFKIYECQQNSVLGYANFTYKTSLIGSQQTYCNRLCEWLLCTMKGNKLQKLVF